MWRRAAIALWVGVATIVLIFVALPLAAATRQFVAGGLVQVAILLPFAVVGGIVANRRPANPIGWLMLMAAFVGAVSDIGGWYAVLAYHFGHPALPLARAGVVVAPIGWFTLLFVLPLTILLFPAGELPTSRWRWPLTAYLTTWVFAIGSLLVINLNWLVTAGTPTIDSTGELKTFDGGNGPGGGIVVSLYGLLALSFVVAQVRAYRGSRGELRQQLKWLMAGGGFCVFGLTFSLVFGGSSVEVVKVLGAIGYFAVLAVPISIGIGVLKYRLYDVDRLISRTVSYTLLTGTLLAVFFGIVLLATRVLPFSSPVAVAASTLAAAALFNPLRRRLQRLVDRRFNRSRYNAEAIVAGFSSRLRGAVDLETVNDELLRAVDRAIEPAHASVWLRPQLPASPPSSQSRAEHRGLRQRCRMTPDSSSGPQTVTTSTVASTRPRRQRSERADYFHSRRGYGQVSSVPHRPCRRVCRHLRSGEGGRRDPPPLWHRRRIRPRYRRMGEG